MQADGKRAVRVVAWTGHRKLDKPAVVKSGVEAVLGKLFASPPGAATGDAKPNQSIVGIGSVAVGADTIVAEALRERGVPLVLLLPFEAARFEADAPADDRRRITDLLAAARLVRVTPRQPSDAEAFLDTGVAMVEQADVLIAVWDGEPARGVGGTKDIVDAANKLGVPVIVVNPVTGEHTWPQGLPTGFGSGDAVPCSRECVVTMYDTMNEAANRHSSRSRLVLFWIVLLHLVASAIAIVPIILSHDHTAANVGGALKIAALLWAVLLALRAHHQHSHWLDARVSAELCRSFLAAWGIPRHVMTFPPAPTQSTLGLRRELELAWLRDPPASDDLEAAKACYLTGAGECDPANPGGRLAGQKRHFQDKARAAKIGPQLEKVAQATTFVAIFAGIAAIMLSYRGESVYPWYLSSKMLSILLPLATAAILSYVTARDLTRRTARYREMAERLEQLERRVAAATTWTALGRAVTDTEWLLQAELAEWHAFTRFAGKVHS